MQAKSNSEVAVSESPGHGSRPTNVNSNDTNTNTTHTPHSHRPNTTSSDGASDPPHGSVKDESPGRDVMTDDVIVEVQMVVGEEDSVDREGGGGVTPTVQETTASPTFTTDSSGDGDVDDGDDGDGDGGVSSPLTRVQHPYSSTHRPLSTPTPTPPPAHVTRDRTVSTDSAAGDPTTPLTVRQGAGSGVTVRVSVLHVLWCCVLAWFVSRATAT